MKQNFHEYLKGPKFLAFSLIIGPVLIGLVIYYVNMGTEIGSKEYIEAFDLVLPLLAAAAILSSQYNYRRLMKGITIDMDLKTKLTNYRAAFIVRFAILEGAALVSIIAFFLNANTLYLIYAGLCILAMIAYRPDKRSILADVPLTENDKQRIEDSNEIIFEA